VDKWRGGGMRTNMDKWRRRGKGTWTDGGGRGRTWMNRGVEGRRRTWMNGVGRERGDRDVVRGENILLGKNNC